MGRQVTLDLIILYICLKFLIHIKGLTSKAFREAAKRISKAVDQVGGDRRRQIQNLWKKR